MSKTTTNPVQIVQIKEFIQKLNECKAQRQKEQPPVELEKTVYEQLQDVMDNRWNDIEEEKINKFEAEVDIAKKAFQVEVAIVEAIRPYINEEILEDIEEVLVKVRKTDNLKSMNRVIHKNKGDIKLRQVVKVLNAVYRYNRNLAAGLDTNPEVKSRIKYASICNECGDIAGQVVKNMAETNILQLP